MNLGPEELTYAALGLLSMLVILTVAILLVRYLWHAPARQLAAGVGYSVLFLTVVAVGVAVFA